jgi:hypothetical protein
VLCGALVPLALQGHAPAAPAAVSRPAQSRTSTIALVAWEGTQPPGYRVSEVPKGWVVQGSNPYRLTIAPPHDPSTNPDDFIGKLVVMLQSRDVTRPPTQGTPQPVNGRPGMFGVRGNTQILTLPDRWRAVGCHPGARVAGLEQRRARPVRQRHAGAGHRVAKPRLSLGLPDGGSRPSVQVG